MEGFKKCARCGEEHYQGYILPDGSYVCWKCATEEDAEKAILRRA